jgi:shikimate dehydrogenase
LDRYAVVGNPIAHSRSPDIHRRFAEQTGQGIEYRKILVELGHFAERVNAFIAEGGRGLNVTLPFKEDAWAYATQLSERAEKAGAVNTLILRQDGGCRGDNTDGFGLVRDLTVNHGLQLAQSRILLLGAGGAARGVLAPLLEQTPAGLIIANRTAGKALALAADFAGLGNIEGGGFDACADQDFDLIINATSLSLEQSVPPLPATALRRDGVVYDMFYANQPTAFVQWGLAHGASRALDGLGMLVEQAAESFYLWRGVRPDTRPVIEALRKPQNLFINPSCGTTP